MTPSEIREAMETRAQALRDEFAARRAEIDALRE
jgi:hypothetical protein